MKYESCRSSRALLMQFPCDKLCLFSKVFVCNFEFSSSERASVGTGCGVVLQGSRVSSITAS